VRDEMRRQGSERLRDIGKREKSSESEFKLDFKFQMEKGEKIK
jgi:hypothetical protein